MQGAPNEKLVAAMLDNSRRAYQHVEFSEDIDQRCPKPLIPEMETSTMADSDHGHDLVTGKSAIGLIGFLASTPIGWFSKRQSSVQSETFGAEFVALKRAIEEAVACRHYLRSFGASVTKPTAVCTDNVSVLKNTTNTGSTLQKKNVALACHFCREQHSANVVAIRKMHTKSNLSDALTKSLDSKSHHDCFGPFMVN